MKYPNQILKSGRKSLFALFLVFGLLSFGFLSSEGEAQGLRGKDAGREPDISKWHPNLQRKYLAEKLAAEKSAPEGKAVRAVAPATPQAGTVIFVYNFPDRLASFDAATPSAILSDRLLVGLDTDNGEVLNGIDFRPATQQLYGIATFGSPGTDRAVLITLTDATTATVTSVGQIFTTPLDALYGGVDFNPIPDRIRYITDSDGNLRINPDTGAATVDTNVAYATGVNDPGQGSNPSINHIAYSNNFVGAASTTLYGIDVEGNRLVTINPPDSGILRTVGPLGVDPTNFGGFDIQQGTNAAYAVLRVNGSSRLYTVNLTTGAVTLVGTVGAIGGTSSQVEGVAIAFGQTTGAPATISGRVFGPDGRGLRNVQVTLSGTDGTRIVTTNSAGFYTIDAVTSGQSYVLRVISRRYSFPQPRTVQVSNSLTNVDFTGQ
jgi:hypothetical protein